MMTISSRKYFFFDVNALIRIYFDDIGSSNLRHIYSNPEFKILTIEFALLEAISALNKSTRDHTVELKIDQVQIILELINSDIERKKINILNSSKYLTANETIALMNKYQPVPKTSFNTSDVLYLSACVDLSKSVDNPSQFIFVTSDMALYQAALLETSFKSFFFRTCNLGNMDVYPPHLAKKDKLNVDAITGSTCPICRISECPSTYIPSF